MLNFAIVPINFHDAKLNQTWEPKAWPAVQRTLNPYNDPFIDRICLLIFNLRRQIKLRSRIIRESWLYKLGDMDELVIEAEHDAFVDELHRVENIYRAYIFDHYLDREADSFDPDKLRFDLAEQPPIPIAYDFPSILSDIVTNSKDPYEIEPVALRPLRSGEDIKDETQRWRITNDITKAHVAAQMQTSWYETGPQAWAVTTSFNHLLWEFAQNKAQDDLNGIAGKTRMLLLNEAIPLPNKHTWLAWYSLCGLNWQELQPAQAAHINRVLQEPVDSILQFVLPCLPMTTEHVNGIPNPGDDSGSGHSLSSKSASHDRTIHGRIIHGRWEAYTVCLDTEDNGQASPPENLIIDDVPFGSTTGRFLAERGLSMWGVALGSPRFYSEASGIVCDPYFRFMHRQMLHFHTVERQAFDTGMRSLGEFHNVHLRFSGNEFGALCAKEWREAFMMEALRFIRTTDAQRLQNEFDAAILRSTTRVIPKKETRGRKAQTDFGLADIFGSDS